LLANDVLVEVAAEVGWLGDDEVIDIERLLFTEFLVQNTFAHADATIANVDSRAGDQFFHFRVALSAEGTHCQVGSPGHEFIGGRFVVSLDSAA
jgi:hypothetical protein